jgi:hypothetical protein
MNLFHGLEGTSDQGTLQRVKVTGYTHQTLIGEQS